MTALPIDQPSPPPRRLLSVTEYTELADPGSELVEGRLLLTPSPTPDDNYASFQLRVALGGNCPDDLDVLTAVDVDLELAGPDEPGFVRRPDLVVVRAEARGKAYRPGVLLCASDVVLAIEICSPESRRTDHLVKRAEYADAGIPRYWIVDIGDQVSITACHHPGSFGYADSGLTVGTFATTDPFDLQLDLARLV
ncbi:Uma2 family endonuclease [Pseudonocardia spinosispora]|uniref:Uma2 family endonuclease n=1 Tax=Pseudonocardia spinosispora TaxID=103441 RepID=UPI00040FF10B|nr:Uma2 family endonuclease [Pseudonocardia spinosispora]